MKFLIVLGILVVVAVAYPKDYFKCIEGVPLKRNDCNYCTCADGKVEICTANLCYSERHKAMKKCQVGLSWMKDCNRCWCRRTGTMCEDKECPSDQPEIDDMDEIIPYNPQCVPGVPLRLNECNYCSCGGVCTSKDCDTPRTNALKKCQVGLSWRKDCNRCWCNNSGTMCETKDCPSDLR